MPKFRNRGDGELYRAPGRNVWMMRFYAPGPDGKMVQVKETTGTTDEKAARNKLKDRLAAVRLARKSGGTVELPVNRRVTVAQILDDYLAELRRRQTKGISQEEYFERCEPWPLNPKGELMLGVKLESPEGIAHCEEILAVPGLAFAELGPGDLGLSLGYVTVPRQPYPPEMQEARARVFGACREHKIAFLEGQTLETITARLDEGVRVIAGGREDTAKRGRAHQKRAMPV